MCVLGVLGNQMKEFRCENGMQGARELSFCTQTYLVKAQFENESTHGRQTGLVEKSNEEATVAVQV